MNAAAAASAQRARSVGGRAIVADCVTLARLAGDGDGATRTRLETALGPELAARLVHALARRERGRSRLV